MKKLIYIVLIAFLIVCSTVLADDTITKVESYNVMVKSDKEGEDFSDLKIAYKLLSVDNYYDIMIKEDFINEIRKDNNYIINGILDIDINGNAYLDTQIINDNVDDACVLVFYLINEKDNYLLEENIIKVLIEKDMPFNDMVYQVINSDKTYVETNTFNIKYKEIIHNVSFINGDTHLEQSVKDNEKAIPVEVQNLNGYEFLGWYLDDELFDFNTNISEDITLIAKFQKTNITIKEPKIEIPDTGIWH